MFFIINTQKKIILVIFIVYSTITAENSSPYVWTYSLSPENSSSNFVDGILFLSQIQWLISPFITHFLKEYNKKRMNQDDIINELRIQNQIMQSSVPASIKELAQNRIEVLEIGLKIKSAKESIAILQKTKNKKYWNSIQNGQLLIKTLEQQLQEKLSKTSEI